MILNINYQISLFIFSLVAGIIIGVFFDLYRLIRGVNAPNNVITCIQDILFWLLTSILVFIFLLYTNYAYVSIYVYVLIFIGLYLYLRFFSKIILSIIYTISKSIYKILRIGFKNIMFCIGLIMHGLKKVFINK